MGRKQILLTGASGTLGQQLLKSRLRNYFDFTCVYRDHVPKICGDKNIILNEWSPEKLNTILQNADTVIHLAGLTRSADKHDLFKSNEELTKTLVNSSNQTKIKSFIFFSTDLAEKQLGKYGTSKGNSEKEIMKRLNCQWTIFRTHPIWVKNPPAQNSTMYKIVESVKQKRTLFLPSGGRFFLSPIWIDDLIDVLLNLLEKGSHENNIVNLHGEEILLRDFLNSVANKYALRVKIIPIPMVILKSLAYSASFLGLKIPIFETIFNLNLHPNNSIKAPDFQITKITDILAEI